MPTPVDSEAAAGGVGGGGGRSGKPVRDRNRPLKVYVTPEERQAVEGRAAEAGLSTSAYLLATGLNHRLTPAYDYQVVQQLAKVSGDLGRLGGLLKLWLAEKRGQGAPAMAVDQVLKETRELQQQMLKLMSRV